MAEARAKRKQLNKLSTPYWNPKSLYGRSLHHMSHYSSSPMAKQVTILLTYIKKKSTCKVIFQISCHDTQFHDPVLVRLQLRLMAPPLFNFASW
jgi:hypothetical protein